MYPNCIPVEGSCNTAFYSLDQRHFTRFSNAAIYENVSTETERVSFDRLSSSGLELLTNSGLLVSDARVSNNAGLQVIDEHEWHSPSIITNATIEVSVHNGLTNFDNLSRLLDMLAQLICKHMFIKIIDVIPVADIANLVDKITSTNTYSVQLVLPYDDEYYSNEFGRIIIGQNKISYVIIEGSPFEKNIEDKIYFSKRDLVLKYEKSESQFSVHHSLFEESQKHHTYFNRKLHIGRAGEIKNALETENVFGFIQEISHFDQLLGIISSPEFQYYWFVHKGICAVCQDCEYRHMCVDNRVPICREDGSWYHALACNYNPYTGKWN
jgi:hypothetical protein